MMEGKYNYEKLHLIVNKLLLIIIAILLFFIGRYSVMVESEIKIPYEIIKDDNQNDKIKELLNMIENFDEIEINNELEVLNKIEVKKEEIKDFSEFLYVASKRGKKYYDINSKSAQTLSEKNKIYFKTKEEAEESGYTK
jgi:hypothetical protein